MKTWRAVAIGRGPRRVHQTHEFEVQTRASNDLDGAARKARREARKRGLRTINELSVAGQ